MPMVVAPGVHLNDIDDVKKWVAKGMRFVTYSYDTKFFKDASREALHIVRNFPIH